MSRSPRRLPDDPRLTDEANRLIDEELEQATGEPIQRIPGHDASRRPVSPYLATLVQSRMAIAMGLAAAVVFGAILALTGGSWWLMALAVALLALAVVAVTAVVLRSASMVERPRQETIERLEDEGVADPERVLNERLAQLDAKPPEPSHEDAGGDGPTPRGTRPVARRRQ